ncbi:MAG TPA: chemotaxis protein CheB, partial [Bacteroidales bacterium]|nr:chemotaxis protein CheB [Bacteroidales bacterium]
MKTKNKQDKMVKLQNTVRVFPSPDKKSNDFPIVGIGASAGGLEALEQFFSNMPENCNMAFVIIQHLDPTRESITSQLLQRVTGMKVLQATDDLKVSINHVYIIPPNK